MNNFYNFINQHWVFSLKEEPIKSNTQLMYELCKRHNCDYERMFLDLLIVFEDYVELKENSMK